MGKLPFAVQPRLAPIIELIGSEESGQIEIERRGYLTSGEKAFVQSVLQQDSGTLSIIDVARRVAHKQGISLQQAYGYVVQCLTNEENPENDPNIINQILLDHGPDLDEALRSLTAARSKEDIIYATCMTIYRIDNTMDINDVMEFHPDIIEQLAELFREEEKKSITRLLNQNTTTSGGSDGGDDTSSDDNNDPMNLEAIEKKQRVKKVK